MHFLYLSEIPSWCDSAKLLLNGEEIPVASKVSKGFAVLNRTFNPGDRITLVLPMGMRLVRWPQNGYSVERGPLVYSYPVKEKWSPVVVPKYSTQEFPCWNANPEGKWNYGLNLNKSGFMGQLIYNTRPMTSDPWNRYRLSASLFRQRQ